MGAEQERPPGRYARAASADSFLDLSPRQYRDVLQAMNTHQNKAWNSYRWICCSGGPEAVGELPLRQSGSNAAFDQEHRRMRRKPE